MFFQKYEESMGTTKIKRKKEKKARDLTYISSCNAQHGTRFVFLPSYATAVCLLVLAEISAGTSNPPWRKHKACRARVFLTARVKNSAAVGY